MAQVQCPNCGRQRVVMEGKRKRCRKCGTQLTGRMGRAIPVVTETVEPEKTELDETNKTEPVEAEPIEPEPAEPEPTKTEKTGSAKKTPNTKDKK